MNSSQKNKQSDIQGIICLASYLFTYVIILLLYFIDYTFGCVLRYRFLKYESFLVPRYQNIVIQNF